MKELGDKNILLKRNNGITLIALIVTIIVLLILAGVGVSTLKGDNGIIKKTASTKKDSRDAEIEEEVYVDVSASKINKDAEVDENKLRNWLTKSFGEEGIGFVLEGNRIDGWTITIMENESSYFVDPEGEFEKTEYEEPINNSDSLVLGFVDDLGTRAMIYLYANPDPNINTVGDTITIKDKNGNTLKNADNANQTTVKAVAKNGEGKLEITGTNYLNAKTYYLAYPVTQNGTYTFSCSKGTTTTETKIRVSNIETFTAIETLANEEGLSYAGGDTKAYTYRGAAIPKGYYVDTKSGTNANPGLVITDSIVKVNQNDTTGYSTGNEWVWVPVNSTVGNDAFYEADATGTMAGIDKGTKALKYGSYSLLYDFTTNATTKETTRTAVALKKPSDTKGYREIAILTKSTYGEKAKLSSNPIYSRVTAKNVTPTALASETAVAEQYIADYNSMVTSVDKYDGFYIGRYEITANGEKPGTSLGGTISGTAWNWFALYNKCMTLNKENTETSMMYGCLWDATMQWLNKSGYVVGKGSTTSGYGNYYAEAVTVSNSDNSATIVVKKSHTGQKLGTGQTSYTKSNNIYDLSGNCTDWTQEAYDNYERVTRGGWCGGNSSYVETYAARRIEISATTSLEYYSARPQLYIK